MKTLFQNAKILKLNTDNGYITGDVVVNGNIIEYVGKKAPNGSYDKVIDVNGNVLMPGFVNAHAHTAMTLLRGVKDDVPLQEWLMDGVVPMEEKMTDEDVYWGQMLGIAEYVRNGITTFEENYFNYEGFTKAINKSGLRARIGIGPKINDRNNNHYQYLENLLQIVKNNTDESLVNVVVYAHSIYTISEDQFYAMVKFANDKGYPFSIHLSETLKEVGDCTVEHKELTPPGYIESLGFLDRPCLCYHCVHMDKDDIQILADYGASVATCPSSNIKLASGIAPIYAMQNKGINICIGTDGVASNNCLDMFKEMFLVSTLSKVSLYDPSVITAKEVLEMATINGARALGVNSGEIEVGRNADIILIDLNSPHMQPSTNIISNLVYSARGSDVYFTMVGGKVVYDNGKYNIGEDIEKIYEKVNEIRKRISSND